MNTVFNEKLQEAYERGYNIGVCVRVQLNDSFLLLKRASFDSGAGLYENPGGSVDSGEGLEEAAARELFEESGIKISLEDLEPLDIFEFHNVETDKHKIKFAFKLKLKTKPDIILSPDHDDFRFFTREEIDALPRQGKEETYLIWEDHYKITTL